MHVVEAALFEALMQSRRRVRPSSETETAEGSEIRPRNWSLPIVSRMAAGMTCLAKRLRHPASIGFKA